MAMAFVQGKGVSSGATPANFAAFGTAVAVGDLIVVECGGDGGITGAISGVTDSLGNTYVQVPSFDFANGAGTLNMDAWYAVVTNAGSSNVVSVAFNDAAENFNGNVQHFNGFTGTATYDQKHTSSNATGTSSTSGATGTLAQAVSLIVGMHIHASTASAWSLGAGYTNLTQSNVAARSAGMQSKVTAATTAVTSAMTIAATRVNMGGVLVFYDNVSGTNYTKTLSESITMSDSLTKVNNSAPTVALNTPADTGNSGGLNPQLKFTGTDPDGDTITYEIQVDTANTFDSQGGTPALIGQTSAAGTMSSVVTTGFDTTGANLIVVHLAYNTGATVNLIDSYGNTWTPLTAKAVTSNGTSQLFYCYNPTVGALHTFTDSGTTNFAALSVMAFSGAASAPFDVQNGATNASASSLAPGSITPTQNNEIVIAGFMFSAAATVSVGGGFSTPTQQNFGSGNNYGGGMAYLIQTTAAAANPTWSTGVGTTGLAATIASFKTAATGPLIDKKSATDTGFADITTPADTDPFNSGDQIGYTIQAGDTLTNGLTYYWRVRAKDPSGTNAFGAWSSIFSFTATSGSSYTKTLSESAAMSDALLKQGNRKLSESITITDVLRKQNGRTFSESFTLADTLLRQSIKALTETITMSDTFASFLSHFKTMTESITVSDTLTRQATKVLRETLTMADTMIRSTSRLLSETITMSDVLLKQWARTFSESFTVADTLLKQSVKVLLETITVTDTFIKQTARSFTESITITDTLSVAHLFSKIFTESITITDSIIKQATRTLSETISMLDTFAKQTSRTFTESFSLSDSFASIRITLKILTESITVTDTLTRSASRLFTESIALADTLLKQTAITFAESITITDVLIKASSRLLSETITLTDTLKKQTSRLFNESITVSDLLLKQISKTFAESFAVADTFFKQTSRKLTETLTITDTLLRSTSRLLIESITMTDTLRKQASRMLSESFMAVDILVRQTSKRLAESITMTDTFSSLRMAGKILTESFTVIDTVTFGKHFVRTFTETITMIDSVFVGLFPRLKNYLLSFFYPIRVILKSSKKAATLTQPSRSVVLRAQRKEENTLTDTDKSADIKLTY